MNFFSGFLALLGIGGGTGGDFVQPPVAHFAPPSTVVNGLDHVAGDGNLATIAGDNAELAVIINSMAAVLSGGNSAMSSTVTTNDWSHFSAGYMETNWYNDGNGNWFPYQQLNPFADAWVSGFNTLTTDSYGDISYSGATNWGGSFNPWEIIPGRPVTVSFDHGTSEHSETTFFPIVGISTFDAYGVADFGGKG